LVSRKLGRVFAIGLFVAACGGATDAPKGAADAQAGTFIYAPTLDKPYRETMRRYEEMSIPGSPLKDAEQWTLEWEALTTRENNLFKRSLKLVALKLNVNGVDQLRGDEVKASMVTLQVLTDKDSNVVDVRGAEDFSAAIVALGAPEAQPILKRVFSPARMKSLAVVRSQEQHADFVGRPAKVGSQWIATDTTGGASREIKVVKEAPCGTARCLQVSRSYDVDRQAVFAEVAERIAAYVQSQGGDPTKVALKDMKLVLEDAFLIDPATMNVHGGRFERNATLFVTGPNGDLSVAFRVRRETDNIY